MRQEEANNWIAKNDLVTEKANVENEAAIVRRDKELIKQREEQVKFLEEQRRLHRFVLSYVVNPS